ncbi:sulfotransferase [Sedimentimonas flavescens]|uniref:Sulfotransferase n=1 Tax=Sedimentimonas flavescens TaxID=2851012 RepID=A0ABT2ZVU6_9RHOB|nr:sulfotransferase [Sedimentimonas flavescens]MCV2877855.1 sulfotransferase [Sedimentimonas flavescens]
MRIICIAGTGRSGSTVLERMIATQGGIAVGELKYLWSRGLMRGELCGCGRPTPECPFWAEVIARALPDGLDPARIEALRRRVERHRILMLRRLIGLPSARYAEDRAEYLAILRRVHAAIAAVSGQDVILDSSKDPAHIDLIRELAPEATILHLVRDSRAVAHSWGQPKRRPEVHWAEEYMPRIGALRAALDWLFINFATARLFARTPGYQLLRYEDLAEGRAFLADLARPDGAALVHSVSGNPLRFDTVPRRLAPDRRWLTDFRGVRWLLVTLLTAPLLWRYGYPLIRRDREHAS